MSHGRLVYYGPPQEAIKYFGVLDFADIYSKVDTPQDAVNWENQYHASSQYQQLITGRQAALQQGVGVPPPRRVNPFASFNPLLPLRQFIILAWRYLDLIFNSAFRMFILLAVMPIIGFLLLLIANGKALVGVYREGAGKGRLLQHRRRSPDTAVHDGIVGHPFGCVCCSV
jgi:hypothetical protein